MSPPGAVVLGGNDKALGVVRSLGRRGVRTVVVVTAGAERVAAASRFASSVVRGPRGAVAQVAFLERLATARGLSGWVLMATDDGSAELIAWHHDRLSRSYRLTVPAWEQLRHAQDKRLAYAAASRAGVAVPWTWAPGALDRLDGAALPFPLVIKPALKLQSNRLTYDRAWRVDDRAELEVRFRRAARLCPPETLLLQELVPGDGRYQYSFAAVCRDGVPLAWLTVRRGRQYPVTFGHSSSFVETVHAPEVEEAGRRLLAELALTGVVEVELKRDPRDGRLKLLDVNPRAWTWQAIGTRAGVDFPFLLHRLCLGEAITAEPASRGVRWMRFSADVLSAARQIRSRELALRSYARSFRPPLVFSIFARDDPLPALVDPPLLLYRVARRRLPGTPWPASAMIGHAAAGRRW